MTTSVRPRAVLVWLHRWVGLTVGVLFTLTCVSGTALYFQPQYWEWAHGDLTPPNLAATRSALANGLRTGARRCRNSVHRLLCGRHIPSTI